MSEAPSRSVTVIATIPAPRVPYPGRTTDAEFLRTAARNIALQYPVGGSNVTATVVATLRTLTTALRSVSGRAPAAEGDATVRVTLYLPLLDVPVSDYLTEAADRLEGGNTLPLRLWPPVVTVLLTVADALDQEPVHHTSRRSRRERVARALYVHENGPEFVVSAPTIPAHHYETADVVLTALGLDEPPAPAPTGPVAHIGGNAEDCPACRASDMELDYPWICPGSNGDDR